MTSLLYTILKALWRPLLYGTIGVLLALLVGFVVYVNSQADLDVWHTAPLDEEFTAESDVHSFADYLALEERLFQQLEGEVYDRVAESASADFNRYATGSLSDPARWPRNWNRSFELAPTDAKAGFLLIHGMSDSPYSMRSIAERLHAAGGHAVGMRMPGHGTAPSGLTTATWEDMAAAVEIGVRHVREATPGRPLYIVGYSNGAALAVHYTLDALEDVRLPQGDGLVLVSPMIGVTRAAALAIWQERIGRLLDLEKLQWNSVSLEYDPFKYGSFAVNAGNQSFQLTREIAAQLGALRESEALSRFPPVLAFQSAADGTVSAPALISTLMEPLPRGRHELVLFDINRTVQAVDLLRSDPGAHLSSLLKTGSREFTVGVISNVRQRDRSVHLLRIEPGESKPRDTVLGTRWPADLFSLSHIALPFPRHDPLYGDGSGRPSPGIRIGNVALRGERGVLRVSAADMLRIRWNPFYPYMEQRVLEFVGLEGAPMPGPAR